MRKRKIIEDEERAQFYNLFRGYNLSDKELQWAWLRYQEVRANA